MLSVADHSHRGGRPQGVRRVPDRPAPATGTFRRPLVQRPCPGEAARVAYMDGPARPLPFTWGFTDGGSHRTVMPLSGRDIAGIIRHAVWQPRNVDLHNNTYYRYTQ